MRDFIPQIEPFGINDELGFKIMDYIEKGPWLTEFTQTERLQDRIAEFLGVKYAFMVPNGTLGLYSALMVMGMGPGKRVVVPDLTMAATAFAVTMTGAEVLLVDICPHDRMVDPKGLEPLFREKIYKPDCYIHVSLNGRGFYPFDPRGERNFYVIEDACQAFGSQWGAAKIGTLGDIGVFSFTPHKLITAGQGGCLVTNNPEVAERIRRFRDFGRLEPGANDYPEFGTNLKYTDLQSVVLLNQLDTIEERILRKIEIKDRYVENGIVPGHSWNKGEVPWYIDILVSDPVGLQSCLRENGIGSRLFYPPIHRIGPYPKLYPNGDRVFPWATEMSKRGLWLPSSLSLTDEEIDYISDVIHFWKRIKEEDS